MLMRLRFILFIIVGSIALLYYGIDNISNSAGDSERAGRNKKCVTLTYEQFVKRHPTEGWFHITGGVLDLPSARAHVTTYGHSKEAKEDGTVNSLDIPLRSAKNYDSDDAPPSPILITSDNSDLMEKWKALDELGKGQTNDEDDEDGQKSTKESKSVDAAQKARLKKYVTENWEKIYVPQDVEGIIKTDAGSEKSDDVSEPDAAPDHMTADYVVLDEGRTGTDYKAHSTKDGVIALTALAAFWGIGLFVYLLGRRPGRGGGGGGTMVTLTNRHGESASVNTDFVNRFRTGPGTGPQNPWSSRR